MKSIKRLIEYLTDRHHETEARQLAAATQYDGELTWTPLNNYTHTLQYENGKIIKWIISGNEQKKVLEYDKDCEIKMITFLRKTKDGKYAKVDEGSLPYTRMKERTIEIADEYSYSFT